LLLTNGDKMKTDFSGFLSEYEKFLNKDEELQRRIKLSDSFTDRDVFFGGPCCLPGSGPYPRASIAYDPTNWAKAKGYSKSILDGKELIEIEVPDAFYCVIKLSKGKFEVKKEKAKDPCLAFSMPFKLFKEMVLGKHKIIWALSDKSVRIKSCKQGISLSDWTTILEILVGVQDLAEMNPEMWRFWETCG